MFEFIRNIKMLKRQSDTTNDIINEFKDTTEKQLKKQNMKIEELLDTIIELEELVQPDKDDKELLLTITMLLDSIDLISKFMETLNEENESWMRQIEILQNNISEQLVKCKITIISNKEQVFNTKLHEIVKTVEGDKQFYKHGQIKNILSQGYMFKGEVIKKAKVEVYKTI